MAIYVKSAQDVPQSLKESIHELHSKEQFEAFVIATELEPSYVRSEVCAIGIARYEDDLILDTFYPHINVSHSFGVTALLASLVGYRGGNATYVLHHSIISLAKKGLSCFEKSLISHAHIPEIALLRSLETSPWITDESTRTRAVVTFIEDTSVAPTDTPDAYLRLHLLSHRLYEPNSINLDGIAEVLPTLAWTNEGPMTPALANRRLLSARITGKYFHVTSLDKFPKMLDYIIPEGVRIVDAVRVRLGASVGRGTIFSLEGSCDFNAGAEGPNIIDGSIQYGVNVGKSSNLSGGSTIKNTPASGTKETITIGMGCTIGTNCIIGISLGDFCSVDDGLTILADTRVLLYDENDPNKNTCDRVRASSLSGKPYLVYQSSHDGYIEVTEGNPSAGHSRLK